MTIIKFFLILEVCVPLFILVGLVGSGDQSLQKRDELFEYMKQGFIAYAMCNGVLWMFIHLHHSIFSIGLSQLPIIRYAVPPYTYLLYDDVIGRQFFVIMLLGLTALLLGDMHIKDPSEYKDFLKHVCVWVFFLTAMVSCGGTFWPFGTYSNQKGREYVFLLSIFFLNASLFLSLMPVILSPLF